MKKKENISENFLPNKQEKLFSYDHYFKLFIKLYKNNLLPNNILLSGQPGLGKSTFAYHFINSILSNALTECKFKYSALSIKINLIFFS